MRLPVHNLCNPSCPSGPLQKSSHLMLSMQTLCYTVGFFIRLPLVLWAGIKAAAQRLSIFARTYDRRLDLLNGKLAILFLNGLLPNTVPLRQLPIHAGKS